MIGGNLVTIFVVGVELGEKIVNKQAFVILTLAQDGNFFSDIILRRTRTWPEPKSEVSHGAIIVDKDGEYLVEQTFPWIQLNLVDKYPNRKVFKCNYLTQKKAKEICTEAKLAKGFYGVGRIFGFMADSIISQIINIPIILLSKLFKQSWKGIDLRLFSRLNITNTMVCTQFLGKLFHDAGYPMAFGKPWQDLTPDDMDDWMTEHTDDWERIE